MGEFAAQAPSPAVLRQRWQELREQLQTAMVALSAADFEPAVIHPRRGVLTGREVLLVVARHAAEYLGQADLTRDLAKAMQAST